MRRDHPAKKKKFLRGNLDSNDTRKCLEGGVKCMCVIFAPAALLEPN